METISKKPVSIWEILEIIQSASGSVKPAALKMAQKVASMEMAKRREPDSQPPPKPPN